LRALRTFVAIELSEECRSRLAAAVDRLRAAAGGVRWVAPQNMHLTLKFIGELEPRAVPEAVSALRQAARGAAPFAMRVEGISAFPPRGAPRVIHAPVREPSGALERLAGRVEQELFRAIGARRETRRFTPHITLGRARRPGLCPPAEELARLAGEPDFGSVSVEEFVLMKSELRPEGALYTRLERFPLGER